MVETIPGCQLALGMNQHRRCWRAILRQLLIGIIRADQGQLDRVDRVGHQDFLVEAGIDHSCLWSIGADQMDWLGWVLLALGSVGRHQLACQMTFNCQLLVFWQGRSWRSSGKVIYFTQLPRSFTNIYRISSKPKPFMGPWNFLAVLFCFRNSGFLYRGVWTVVNSFKNKIEGITQEFLIGGKIWSFDFLPIVTGCVRTPETRRLSESRISSSVGSGFPVYSHQALMHLAVLRRAFRIFSCISHLREDIKNLSGLILSCKVFG